MYAVSVNSSGLFVAVGYTNTVGAIYSTSTNGSTWTTPTTIPSISGSGSTGLNSITVNSSDLFVAVGYRSFTTSKNGSTWTPVVLMGGSVSSNQMFGVAVNSSGLFATVGQYNNQYASYAVSN
jgi:photosystem II stability/assembly factor-like uncharacterized protein